MEKVLAQISALQREGESLRTELTLKNAEVESAEAALAAEEATLLALRSESAELARAADREAAKLKEEEQRALRAEARLRSLEASNAARQSILTEKRQRLSSLEIAAASALNAAIAPQRTHSAAAEELLASH